MGGVTDVIGYVRVNIYT